MNDIYSYTFVAILVASSVALHFRFKPVVHRLLFAIGLTSLSAFALYLKGFHIQALINFQNQRLPTPLEELAGIAALVLLAYPIRLAWPQLKGSFKSRVLKIKEIGKWYLVLFVINILGMGSIDYYGANAAPILAVLLGAINLLAVYYESLVLERAVMVIFGSYMCFYVANNHFFTRDHMRQVEYKYQPWSRTQKVLSPDALSEAESYFTYRRGYMSELIHRKRLDYHKQSEMDVAHDNLLKKHTVRPETNARWVTYGGIYSTDPKRDGPFYISQSVRTWHNPDHQFIAADWKRKLIYAPSDDFKLVQIDLANKTERFIEVPFLSSREIAFGGVNEETGEVYLYLGPHIGPLAGTPRPVSTVHAYNPLTQTSRNIEMPNPFQKLSVTWSDADKTLYALIDDKIHRVDADLKINSTLNLSRPIGNLPFQLKASQIQAAESGLIVIGCDDALKIHCQPLELWVEPSGVVKLIAGGYFKQNRVLRTHRISL